MKLASTLLITMLTAIAPAFAGEVSPVDTYFLKALEVRYFAHEDTLRTPTERVARLEQLVYGTSFNGDEHERIHRLVSVTGGEAATHPAAKHVDPPHTSYSVIKHDPWTAPAAATTASDNGIVQLTGPVYFRHAATIQNVVTVADRIEQLELSLFGRKSCADKLQKRVARLERSIFGSDQFNAQERLTLRVNRLWTTVKSG